MANVIVIGGGLAGLSSAVYLTKAGHKVTLLEASPKLGGRAYSFMHPGTKTTIDNGQHIMMGCYENTLDYLYLINAEEGIELQKKLNVDFRGRGGKKFSLNASWFFYPLNLLISILGFKALSFSERIKVIKFFARLFFLNIDSMKNLTVSEMLTDYGFKKNIRKSLFDILVVGTLNTSPDKASASVFADVLKKMFFKGNFSSTIIIPKVGLSELFCRPSVNFIIERGGNVIVSEKVTELKIERDTIVEVVTAESSYRNFDHVVSAIPLYSIKSIIPNYFETVGKKFSYSPIVTLHVWLDVEIFTKRFYGLINSKIDWLFNHQTHISLITSNAGDLVNLDERSVADIFFKELADYFPEFNPGQVVEYKLIKEKRATFIPTPGLDKTRKSIISPYNNLTLAGDWTNSGLPSTIEGAVKSGIFSAECINNNF